MDERNPWTRLAREIPFENDYIRVHDDEVLDAKGRRSRYGTVATKKPGVAVLPIDHRGRTVLVGQWRYALGQWRWEVCKGGRETSEEAELCARRELEEEANLRPRWIREILTLDHAAAVLHWTMTGFLAWDVEERAGTPDPQEVLKLRTVPFAEAVDMALSGVITDSTSVALILKVEALRRRGELPGEVTEVVGS
jgi:8-oxo-dGTP pyrophosphatase MutT (NUDIX family)